MWTLSSEEGQTIAQTGYLFIEDGLYVIIKAEDFKRNRRERDLLKELLKGEQKVENSNG